MDYLHLKFLIIKPILVLDKMSSYDLLLLKYIMLLMLNFREINGYVDASFASPFAKKFSITGFVILSAGGLMSWMSEKQRIVADSNGYAEFIAIHAIAKEIKFII